MQEASKLLKEKQQAEELARIASREGKQKVALQLGEKASALQSEAREVMEKAWCQYN